MKIGNQLVRVTLKESRGDGDSVDIEIINKDSITVKERHIEIMDAEGCLCIFSIHNVLYLKTYFLIAPLTPKTIEGLPPLNEL